MPSTPIAISDLKTQFRDVRDREYTHYLLILQELQNKNPKRGIELRKRQLESYYHIATHLKLIDYDENFTLIDQHSPNELLNLLKDPKFLASTKIIIKDDHQPQTINLKKLSQDPLSIYSNLKYLKSLIGDAVVKVLLSSYQHQLANFAFLLLKHEGKSNLKTRISINKITNEIELKFKHRDIDLINRTMHSGPLSYTFKTNFSSEKKSSPSLFQLCKIEADDAIKQYIFKTENNLAGLTLTPISHSQSHLLQSYNSKKSPSQKELLLNELDALRATILLLDACSFPELEDINSLINETKQMVSKNESPIEINNLRGAIKIIKENLTGHYQENIKKSEDIINILPHDKNNKKTATGVCLSLVAAGLIIASPFTAFITLGIGIIVFGFAIYAIKKGEEQKGHEFTTRFSQVQHSTLWNQPLTKIKSFIPSPALVEKKPENTKFSLMGRDLETRNLN